MAWIQKNPFLFDIKLSDKYVVAAGEDVCGSYTHYSACCADGRLQLNMIPLRAVVVVSG